VRDALYLRRVPSSPRYQPAPRFLGALDAAALLAKLGVAAWGPDHDPVLVEAVFAFLEESGIGNERFFFDLQGGLGREARALGGPVGEKYQRPSYEALRGVLAGYAPARPERVEATYFQGEAPCTLIIDEVRASGTPSPRGTTGACSRRRSPPSARSVRPSCLERRMIRQGLPDDDGTPREVHFRR
jgi:hypothetical protein